MRLYVLITGVLFGLLVLAHLLRLIAESPRLALDPLFVVFTALPAGLCFWAWRLLRRGTTD
jgi:hypothetical protein